MGIGASITLLAIGAILTFAVTMTISGVDINVIGIILMACGALGLVLSMIAMGRRGHVHEDHVVTRDRDVY